MTNTGMFKSWFVHFGKAQTSDAPSVVRPRAGIWIAVAFSVLLVVIVLTVTSSLFAVSLERESLNIRLVGRLPLMSIEYSSMDRVECVSPAGWQAWKNPLRALRFGGRPLSQKLLVTRNSGWFNRVFLTPKNCDALRQEVIARLPGRPRD